jgi:hypothetical protein
MAPSVDTISPSDFSQDYYSSGLRAKFSVEVARLTANITQPSRSAAEIAYEPNLSSYLSRSSTRAGLAGLEKEVPKGWPQVLTGPLAWAGSDFKDESEWVCTLSDDDKEEVNRALEHFKSKIQCYHCTFSIILVHRPSKTDSYRSRNFLRQYLTRDLPFAEPRPIALENS